MMSTFLDGTGATDLRENKTIRPHYRGIVSLVYYDGLFYWTNGSKVFMEDYDATSDKFYFQSDAFFRSSLLRI